MFRRVSRLAQQLRQLGDVGGHAPGLVAGEEVRRRAPTGLLLAIDVGERLPVGVTPSLDHLVGGREQRGWYFETYRFGSLQVEDQLIFGRRLHG